MTLSGMKDDAWAQDDLDGSGSLQDPDWQALYLQFQCNHALGTVPYRWESSRDYKEAQLLEVTFEDLRIVVLGCSYLHDTVISGADKAHTLKMAMGIDDGLLMEYFGKLGKAVLVRETDAEWELLVPHCLLPHVRFKERVVARWRRHTHMPVTDKWCDMANPEEWMEWHEGFKPPCISEVSTEQLLQVEACLAGVSDITCLGISRSAAPQTGLEAETTDVSLSSPVPNVNLHESEVPGFWLALDFLNEESEARLIAAIDQGIWKLNRAQTRRVQMFGVKHDDQYRVHAKAPLTELPSFASTLIDDIHALVAEHFPSHAGYMYKLGTTKLTELFVNEYDARSSLQFHTDHNLTYEDMIIGISLGADSILRFENQNYKYAVKLARQSAYFMTGPSRVDYKHGMLEGDCLGPRRVSLTFRVVRESAIIK